MKQKLFAFITALLITVFGYSQSSAPNQKAPQFAIVILSPAGSAVQCIAKYSDGSADDLKTKLNMAPQKSGFKMVENEELEEGYEFSLLQYMHDKGYVLLAKSEMKYYFELK